MHCFKPLPLVLAVSSLFSYSTVTWADNIAQSLPYSQDWSNTALITITDDWSAVPGIIGYRGDGLTASPGTDPQTILADGTSTPVDVNVNQTSPNTNTTGGVTEFHLTDPSVALQGSGTADAPFILIHLNTSGMQSIQVAYTLRDLDGSADNAVQPVALQYRIGNSGSFTNVPAAYVADATSGPSMSSQTTPVSVMLPAAADNQPLLQLRMITSDAVGSDEWVGIDNISVNGTSGGAINQPISTICPASVSLAQGTAGSYMLTATDADSMVNGAEITGGAISGISLAAFTPAIADGGNASVTLNAGASLAAGNYAVQITFSNNEVQNKACTVNIAVENLTPIPVIQGSGASSPKVGQTLLTMGVVTKLTNNGFFLQDEAGDNNDETSDGILVFTGVVPTVAVGDRIRLSATVSEFKVGTAASAQANPVTELTSPSGISVLASGISIEPKIITFPEVYEGDLERYEGMLVAIREVLTVSQNYFEGRYGQVTLSAEGRLNKPTNLFPANSADANAVANDNARRRITLDDGSSIQNPNPIPFIGEDNTLRAGDTVAGVTGVIDYGLVTSSAAGASDYKIHPVITPAFSRDNPRSVAPASVGGNVKVASFNVLNYFTTFTNGSTVDGQTGQGCTLGNSTSAANCRGADNLIEFNRQRDKIVNAIKAIDADVLGLMEIQNNSNAAVQNLVDALNTTMGANTYASVDLPDGGTGTDAIRVAMIYKPGKLSPVGNAVSDTDPIHNRPPLAQTFSALNGEKFSVVVNHFKSKGSCPTNSSDADADQGDGQGCWNTTRVQQSQELLGFISARIASVGDNDVIVIGDLNAYGKEDPILALTNGGLVDEIARHNSADYSYVFDGEAGYIDHALATSALSGQVTGTEHWHINADEPSVIDYNTEFKQPACATCSPDLYTSTPYRASDHDPVVVGLKLMKPITGTSGRDTLVGTAGDDIITGGAGADILTGNAGRDQFVLESVLDGVDTITDFQVGTDLIVLTSLLQALGITSATPLADGYVLCTPYGINGLISIDPDAGNSARSRSLVLVKNVSCNSLATPSNFNF